MTCFHSVSPILLLPPEQSSRTSSCTSKRTYKKHPGRVKGRIIIIASLLVIYICCLVWYPRCQVHRYSMLTITRFLFVLGLPYLVLNTYALLDPDSVVNYCSALLLSTHVIWYWNVAVVIKIIFLLFYYFIIITVVIKIIELRISNMPAKWGDKTVKYSEVPSCSKLERLPSAFPRAMTLAAYSSLP